MQSASLDANVGPETKTEPPFTDDELLAIVRGERSRSAGFDLDSELTEARETTLNYIKGVMDDIPSLPNRSKATTSDIADAVETVLPDLLDIFTGGDDVLSFQPQNAEDEQQAQQETDYTQHVIFDDNDGFHTFLTWFKDALQVKTGIVKSWWEAAPTVDPETFTGKTAMEVDLAQQDGEVSELRPSEEQGDGLEPLYDFTLTRQGPDGRVRIMAIAPNDFTVTRDTVKIKEAPYSAFKSRPRAQELIADGHDRDIIDTLPPYGQAKNQTEELARDTAGENDFPTGNDGPDRDRRVVEVVEHYVRALTPDGKIELWRVLTGGDESILIASEKVDRIPFAVITPYVVPHRFYGESVGDKLIETQRVRTALLRSALDSAYFALNQRHEVVMGGTNGWTLSDLLDNRPGNPVRVDTAGTINPLPGSNAPFDYFGALEFMSTQAEQRTGIVRNAQGLNPDTLHDTASGAIALMGAAQRRVRMIARVFAETGVKDLFLDVHALLRKHASKQAVAKLRGQWVPVDPSGWSERNEVVVEVGVGSGGKEQRAAALGQVMSAQESLAKILGPTAQQIVTLKNVYNTVMDATKAMGLKTGQSYWTDPGDEPQPQQPPPPDPAAQAAQVKAQTDAQRLQGDQAEAQARLQLDAQTAQANAAATAAAQQQAAETARMNHQRDLLNLQGQDDRERQKLAAETQLKLAEIRQRYDAEQGRREIEEAKLRQAGELAVLELQAKYQTTIDAAQIKAASDALRAKADVQIQAMESEDTRLEQMHEHVADAHQHDHEIELEVMRQSAAEPEKGEDDSDE